MQTDALKELLDNKVDYFNRPSFIANDPICIPHRFTKKQDIEISGFFAAIFAWGQRKTIINKATELLQLMDHAPYDFILHHQAKDLKPFVGFKHRTFMDADLFFILSFLQQHYLLHDSLENAFLPLEKARSPLLPFEIQACRLSHFYNYIFSFEHLKRTEKHIATPAKNSACKRINMYLRWMVRQDKKGVDFGLWQHIPMTDLVIPLDLHVCRIAQRLGLMPNTKANWSEAVNLSLRLSEFAPHDPARYDFALFGMGVVENKP